MELFNRAQRWPWLSASHRSGTRTHRFAMGIRHRLRQQLLQPAVVLLELPQPPGIGHSQPAECRPPFAERGRADRMTAAHLRRRRPSLLLLQNRDDLLFAEPASLQYPPTSLRRALPRTGHISGEHVKANPVA